VLTEDDEKSENPAEIPVVLLVNLGTPESPSPRDIRRFLREFLSDRRVIEAHLRLLDGQPTWQELYKIISESIYHQFHQ